MSHFRMLLCCVVLLSLVCGCEKKEATPESRAEDERAIRELEIEASKALAAKDLDKLVSLYADNAALYYDYDPTIMAIMGKEAIRENWRTILENSGFVLSTKPRSIEVSSGGDLAWAHGVYTMTMNDAAGKPIADAWDYSLVYKKQPDGIWKIMADTGNSGVRTHLFPKPPKRSYTVLSAFVAFIWLACYLGSLLFLFGMPIVALLYAGKFCRSGKFSTGFLVSAIMLITFFVTAVLLWRHLTAQYWNLSFTTALRAAGDTERYGNPVEDTAENVLVPLLVLSTLSAAAAGAIAGAARTMWIRHRRPAV